MGKLFLRQHVNRPERRLFTSRTTKSFTLACCQFFVRAEKQRNLETARSYVEKAAQQGAKVVVLPECFNSPYSSQFFRRMAERLPPFAAEESETVKACKAAAKDNSVWLIAGSIPEVEKVEDHTRIFNTCLAFNPDGEIVAKYRKMHLFDIAMPGVENESLTFTAGSSFTTFKTEFATFGIGLCNDLRFPECAAILSQMGAEVLLFPGICGIGVPATQRHMPIPSPFIIPYQPKWAMQVVNKPGDSDWELLSRARAIDNQVYLATASPARQLEEGRRAIGYSTIVDPWGEILATIDQGEGIVVADINLDRIDEVQSMIPISKQRRNDLYHSVESISK